MTKRVETLQVGGREEERRALSDYWAGSKARCAKCGGLLGRICEPWPDGGEAIDYIVVGGHVAVAVECFECGGTTGLLDEGGGSVDMVAVAVE